VGRGQPGRDGRTGRWRVTWKSTSFRMANLRDRGERLGFGIRIDRAKQNINSCMWRIPLEEKTRNETLILFCRKKNTKTQMNDILGRAVFHDFRRIPWSGTWFVGLCVRVPSRPAARGGLQRPVGQMPCAGIMFRGAERQSGHHGTPSRIL